MKKTSLHPWRVAAQLKKNKLPARAGLIQFEDFWFMYSPKSNFRMRRLGPPEPRWFTMGYKGAFIQDPSEFRKIFSIWLGEHLQLLLNNKISMLKLSASEDPCFRWVFSENDFLPGLIIDVFHTDVVCELLTAPIDLFWPEIKPIVQAAYEAYFKKTPTLIECRNNLVRAKEGLDIISIENPLTEKLLNWNGLKWWMTPAGQQKTGSYLDQRENHICARDFARELKAVSAWDLCSFEGGFSLHLANAGISTLAIDQSEAALLKLQKNARANNISDSLLQTYKSDVFTFLKEQKDKSERVDFIVLDPPSFVRSKSNLHSGLRGYLELNELAIKMLSSGGGLVSCTCSQAVSEKIYLEVLQNAAQRAEREIFVQKITGPSPDHKPDKHFPEGDYLRAYYLKVK